MADISLVRTLIGDRTKKAVNEVVGRGDGVNVTFKLDMFPLVSGASASIILFDSGLAVATANVTISGGVGVITFASAAAPTGTILATYDYNAISSGELTDICSGLDGKPYMAASRAAMVLVADSSKLFAYTMGDKTVDKRRVADNLLKMSTRYENLHFKQGDRENYTATVFTFKDNSATPYDNYDNREQVFLGTTTGLFI